MGHDLESARWQSVHEHARRIDAALFPPPGCDPAEAGLRWYSLLYLGFLFVPAVALWTRDVGVNWALTLASIAVFLPLYVVMYRYKDWRAGAAILATAALGCLLLPYNAFSNTYIIYACAGAAYLPYPRNWLIAAVSFAAFAATALSSNMPSAIAVFVLALTALVSFLVMVSNLVMRAKAAKQAALRLSQEEVSRLAALAERERIGRDLHDLLGHTLSVIAIKSELAARLADRDPAAAKVEIEDVERIAREALGQVRGAVAGMRAVGLKAELANARLALAAVEVDFEYVSADQPLHSEIETVLALALRESVTNIIRHARARRVSARFVVEGERVVLVVRDDGRGGARLDGNGLTGMRERVEALGGALSVVSLAGQGTELELRLPFRPPAVGADGRAPLRIVAGRATAA
jgi:two-component system sensor histidine kinase DesK